MLHTKEHYEMMAKFEKEFTKKFMGRIDREEKTEWERGNYYQDGMTNSLFKMFQLGYVYGKAVAQE